MTGGACEVWFYHLERTALDQALPELLEKTLARGWRALVRTVGAERVEHLDSHLWTWREDAFLPHGVAGEDEAPRQPVLLTTAMDNPNGAHALFLVDGAEAGPLEGFARCVVMFDGRDEQALADARQRWKVFKSEGLPVSYWRQSEQGRWEKQA
ncbi:DNA polymerase III subunit chi [Caulobacter sp. 17J80-11]|uniref:DNA polymerase III subunit chi n=1 Tax=Caulobacter sp. 17J80-11 TaxID=2763502 RepID=UPI001653BB14|nr:DNA polymerase III subunit chi [Caulobacter sp. 17J80-11]MBC6983029.1 DNA polymerase III subunit chi [Caulobacter sp. 17J80-11]